MQNLQDNLVYFLVLAGALVANYLFKRFGPDMEPPARESEPDAPEIASDVGAMDVADAEAPRLVESRSALVRSTPSRAAPRSPSTRFLVGSRRNMQTAVAMATILGPCLASEPDGGRAASGR